MTMRRFLSTAFSVALVLSVSSAHAQEARVYGTALPVGNGTQNPGATYYGSQPVGNYSGTQAPVGGYDSQAGANYYGTQAPQAYTNTQAPAGGYGAQTGSGYYDTQAPQAYTNTQAPAGGYAGQAQSNYYGTQAPQAYSNTQAPAGGYGAQAQGNYYGTQAPQAYSNTQVPAGGYGQQAPGAYNGTQAPQAYPNNIQAPAGTYGQQGSSYYGTQAPQASYANTQAPAGGYGGGTAAGNYASTQAPQAAASGIPYSAIGTGVSAASSLGQIATTQAPQVATSQVASTMASVGGAGVRTAVSHAGQFMGNSVVWTGLGALAAGGGAAALVGGGGGGGTTSDDCHKTYNCPEYYKQYSLDKYDSKTAYVRGAHGKGSTVALIDTGLDVNGFEFRGRVVDAYDFVTNQAGQPNASDLSSHGTEVAGVLGAERNDIGMHGIAPETDIMPLRVFNKNNESLIELGKGSFAPAIDYARTHGAHIINGSYGPDNRWHLLSRDRNHQIITEYDTEEGEAYKRAAAADIALVFPAGNSFRVAPNLAVNPTGPGFLPFISPDHANITDPRQGAYRSEDGSVLSATDFSSLRDMTIVVVGLNKDGTIADYSNRCGVAKDWCMAAYSEDIYTTTLNGEYVTVDGTSYASPQIAGALAALKQLFPNLTMKQLIDRLKKSAKDLGLSGVDAIYGWGELDMERASQPIGSMTIAVYADPNAGPRYDLTRSDLRFGKAFGLGASAQLGGMEILFLDSQGAAFKDTLDKHVDIRPDAFDAMDALSGFGTAEQRQQMQVTESIAVGYAMAGSNSESFNNMLGGDAPKDPFANDTRFTSLSLTNKLSDTMETSFHYRDADALSLGFTDGDRDRYERAIAKDGLKNPYAAFANGGYASIIKMEALGGTMRIAGFFGNDEQDKTANNFGSQAEMGYKLAKGSDAFFSFGSLFEENRVLGSEGTGAFSFGNGTSTVYTGAGTKLALGENTTFRASVYAGWTNPKLANDTLIENATSIITSSFNASIEHKGLRQKDDSLSFGVSQPLRVESGDMTFYIPSQMVKDVNLIASNKFTQDLAGSGREIDMEVSYAVPLGDGERVSAGGLYRFNAGHVVGNDDALGVVRWSKKF